MEKQYITLLQANEHGFVVIKAKQIAALREHKINMPGDPLTLQIIVHLANSNTFFEVKETIEEINAKIQELPEDMRPW